MATKANTAKITDDKIISIYMDFVLEHEVHPKSIYKFCKENKIKEDEFYQFFGSFEALQKGIWNKFFTNTTTLLNKNKEYEGFSNKDKMLTFFYTIFELLTMNRSYVLFTLGTNRKMLDKMSELKDLRSHIKNFTAELIEESNEDKNLKITKQSPRIFSDGAWVQFLFLLKFWMDDSSAGFEKTDLAIEKSVTTIFDVFDNTPLDSIIDFGKFLYKENFA
ncbi:TetR family transcriptional regulator C-terminal domain-containing protein [Croceitalea rosinachiae]|uniref:TetR family transcriptional regulator C-terminal domain-containing protein n=1 Tax=Croceitalea rosinachiae TaxID=3075596 RepID=A0ABU3A9Q7_9FLAO|nr:TetR family transcriptional regulator C-terminal domain-containing protein [Croceitalea sp. F388]MDT0606922.1 TetR family transcriptional regulator C-terminal domain-containing protein [Croceitalea sp. F388]